MQSLDTALLGIFVQTSEWLPILGQVARGLTELGGVAVLVPITVLATVWLVTRQRWRSAIVLLALTLTGRLCVELLKLTISRPRPPLADHAVLVTSMSLPSGHAANATITYLTLALLLPISRSARRAAIPAALILAFAIGLTRPLLGVHYPADVLAGWSFGILWTLTGAWMLDHWTSGQPASRPPRTVD